MRFEEIKKDLIAGKCITHPNITGFIQMDVERKKIYYYTFIKADTFHFTHFSANADEELMEFVNSVKDLEGNLKDLWRITTPIEINETFKNTNSCKRDLDGSLSYFHDVYPKLFGFIDRKL